MATKKLKKRRTKKTTAQIAASKRNILKAQMAAKKASKKSTGRYKPGGFATSKVKADTRKKAPKGLRSWATKGAWSKYKD